MKWNDLDLERKLVCLTRKDCAAQGLQRSERLVPLSPKAVKLLGQYPKKQQQIIGLSTGSARHGFDRARKAHSTTLSCSYLPDQVIQAQPN